jgi:hypothetical protein
MSVTAESIKSSIKDRLLEMAESRHELLKQASRLSSLGIDVKNTSLYIGSCLESVTDTLQPYGRRCWAIEQGFAVLVWNDPCDSVIGNGFEISQIIPYGC